MRRRTLRVAEADLEALDSLTEEDLERLDDRLVERLGCFSCFSSALETASAPFAASELSAATVSALPFLLFPLLFCAMQKLMKRVERAAKLSVVSTQNKKTAETVTFQRS